MCVRRAESRQLGFSCVIMFCHQRAVSSLFRLFQTGTSLICSVTSSLLLLLNIFHDCHRCSSPKKVSLTTHLAHHSLYLPPLLPLLSELLSLHALRCPLCQPSIREGYEGSALLRGSSPRWILRLPRRPLMVKGEPAGSQMDPLQAGRHTDWLSLKKHHLCVPTGGGCN